MKFRSRKTQTPIARQRVVRQDDAPSPTPFTYYARRDRRPDDAGRSPKEQQPKRIQKRSFAGIPLKFALLVLLVGGLGLLWMPGPTKVELLTRKGAPQFNVRDRKAYSDGANEIVRGSMLNHFKPTFNAAATEAAMRQEFPELATVKATTPFIGGQPTVYIEVARPTLLLSATNGVYVIDNRGRALALKDNIAEEQTADLTVVTDQSNIRVKLNKQVLTTDNIAFIRFVLAQLDAKGVRHTSLTLPANANELDVQLDGQPYFIKFNLASNTPRSQVGTMLATIGELKKKNIVPTKYIDVRVEGRAYYL
jgi:hypothetical protein